jgi:hypothetical protein
LSIERTGTILRIHHPPTYAAERRYVHDVLLGEFLGLEYRAEVENRHDVRITTSEGPPNKALILMDILFQTSEDEWLTPASLPRRPLDLWEVPEERVDARLVSRRLPVVYGSRLSGGSFCETSGEKVTLGLDVFGSAFFALTRYEEAVKPDKDARERFPAAASLAHQEGFLDRPIVNEYLEVLWWALRRLWPGLRRKPRASRVYLSHDVDRPFCTETLPRTVKGIIEDVTRRKKPALAVQRARSFARVRRGDLNADVCNTFGFIMDLSEKHGLRSTFNFMSDRSAGRIDGNYSIDDPWIRGLLRCVHERGHEVGLHTSYNTFRDPSMVRREFDLLLRAAQTEDISQQEWGGRQHYLRWEVPTTWQAWEDAGLAYDSTLGFADSIGFRCGVCYEYPVFNLGTHTTLRLRERPLIVMEASALEEGYMSLTFEQTQREIAKLKERCELFEGDFALLWHNNRLIDEREREIYRSILEPR